MWMMNGVSTFSASEDAEDEPGAKQSEDVEHLHWLIGSEASSAKCTFQFHTGTGAAAEEVKAWPLSLSGKPLAGRSSEEECR